MVNNTVYQFVGSNLGVEIFLNKRERQKKGEMKNWGFSVHFVLAFQGNSIHTLHLRFSQDITQWCNVYTKTDSWFQESYKEFGQLQTSSGKYKKLKLHGLVVSKECIPSAKTYTEDLSFNYWCENSPNSLCHF